MNPSEKQIYCFADVELDTSRGCLKRNGDEQHLRQKTFQVLVYLLEQNERLVTKEELIENIWKETAVTDDTLAQCVKDIRRALGDDPRQPRFIKTVPKFGYRFIGPVTRRIAHSSFPAFIETEEVTSVKVEYEEETGDGVTGRWGDGAMTNVSPFLPVSPSRRLLSRHRVAAASALILVTAVAFSLYFWHQSSQSKRQLSETTLPPVLGKKPIAVMFFENRAGRAEFDWLSEGLADMLITDLSRSTRLTVLSRQQLLQLLERVGQKPEERIQLDRALEIARSSRAEAVVLGSFTQIGEKVRIDVQLHDARSGQLLATETMNVDKVDQILTQVDLLALKLATHLGAAPAEQEKKPGLADVMTDNLEAYRYYSLALEKAQGMHNTEAIALLQKAVALDPQFAMAHARIGYTYTVSWNFADKAKPYLEKAFQLSHRLTERDKLYINAWYAMANRDYPRAVEAYRNLIVQYPLEIEAYERLGILLASEERGEEAAEVLKQGLVIDSAAKDLYNALGGAYSSLGRHDEAIAMCQRYVALAPEEPNAHDSLGLSYQWAGQYDAALAEYNQALALNPRFEVATVHLGNLYFHRGRYREATNQYQRYVQIAPSDLERARGYDCLARVSLKKGDLDRAQDSAQRTIGYERHQSVSSLLLALEHGNVSKAESFGVLLNNWPYINRGRRLPKRYYYYFNGIIALESGRAAEAIENFKEGLRRYPPFSDIDSFEDCLANAYLKLGQIDDAIAEYGRILRLNPNYPLVHYHLAQAYERKGQREQARAEQQRFLAVWKDADVDIPEVLAAKEQLNKQW